MLTDRKYAVARKWSNRKLRRIAPLFEGEVVNVSAWMDSDKEGAWYRDYFTRATSYYWTNHHGYRGYQGVENEYELDLTGDLPDHLYHRFDVVFNHTTLEHVFDVFKAFENICNMSRDIVILVVPFCQVQHESESWGDYWRFTPTCLRQLFARSDFQVVYESENKDKNAGIYLFFVASRTPEVWAGKLPYYTPIETAGAWIGASKMRLGYEVAARLMRRLVSRIEHWAGSSVRNAPNCSSPQSK